MAIKRFSKREFERLLEGAFESASDSVSKLSDSDNPQVIEMRNKMIGRNEAYLTALQAIRGNHVPLRIDAGVYA